MISFALCHICHFNSRLCGDEHKSLVAVLINQLNFNSRLPKETNRHVIFFNSFIDISTHVSVRRRTVCLLQYMHFHILHFNSRLRKETNDADYAERGTLCDFNSRLCQGDEQHLQVYQRMEVWFQLTSPQGDEHDTPFPKIRQDHFNSRLRKETNI